MMTELKNALDQIDSLLWDQNDWIGVKLARCMAKSVGNLERKLKNFRLLVMILSQC